MGGVFRGKEFAMFYGLAYKIFGVHLFSYVTFRAFAAAGTAFVLSLLLGRRMIAKLRAMRVGQMERDGREMAVIGHAKKAGTPTMGGLLILFTTTLAALLWGNLGNAQLWLVTATMLLMGAVGFVDDYLKLRRGKSDGLSERQKLLWQGVISLGAFAVICWIPETREYATRLYLPFLKEPVILNMTLVGGALFAWLVITATTNAVNLTDGLDGLAAGCASSVVATYLVMAYVAGHAGLAGYLLVPAISGSHELAVFCGGLLGGCLGFLWWNGYPAKVFMGDTGSLALGGAVAMTAILIRQELTLLIAGAVFVAEAASVLIQRGACKFYRWRTGTALEQGRRPFRMTPLHHHFEILSKERAREEGRGEDSAENSVVVRFWIAGVVCALLGLATLKLR